MTHRYMEQYDRAKAAIVDYLRDPPTPRDDGWVGSRELHEDLRRGVPKDWLFGAVKKELGIPSCQVEGRFWWRLPRLGDLR